ncbi:MULTISPECIES: copper resistance system multicopper oxidase [unclassified Sphingopyxis]|jgi:CopA family copper-resistance protein|uniref:copper resistance system multicopper oxidase n=1 Tax=unclassified Sphingopyxis TaxID=2614943 RepID=UPI0007818BC3|nr:MULTISPECIES: copper resistance system multicopper oxidase [unclassified Sphingopyxis]USI79380.1 copper resistance system multicopper oxidase [Sphingopyxis sp. USTB-05]
MQVDRRRFVSAALGGGAAAAAASWFPAWAQPVSQGITAPLPTVSGNDITLRIARQTMRIDGKLSRAIGINGTVPAPLVRLKEGQTAKLTVVNDLDEDSSIHWHGLILPFHMDGVPGVSFPGIKPRSKFVYEFPVVQSGTYWYHSHSGLQEQLGHYGPIVIDPAGADPIGYDREHVVVLSDHSQLSPEAIFRKLKVNPGHFNMQRQTLSGLLSGKDQSLKERIEWGAMRMDPTDVADVNGSTYTFLVNGYGPRDNWTALFNPGERVRLRIVNASAMTIFNIRIPGLRMTVVQADGLNVVPTEIDEFQIAVAETYDVIVTPVEDRAYTLVAEANDRSGMGRATLAPRAGMAAEVPPLRERPLATMKDMGMGAMTAGDAACTAEHAAMGHCKLPPADGAAQDHAAMGHGAGGMQHSMRDFSVAAQVKRDPSVQTISPMPVDRMGEPGQGLEDVGHKVMTYHDLVALDRNPDVRAAERSLDIHLTGNMERFMWSFDGVKMSDHHEPIPFIEGERVRINLINDSMMSHPIHLHGHFFELVTGKGDHSPRKHTVLVQPGGTASFDFTADAIGDWAFHCHMLYHMHAGMMRVVSVRPRGEAA